MQYLEGRKYVVQTIFVVVALLFAARLFYIQVLDGSYKLAADRNSLQRIVQVPYRGLIFDRNGKLIVQNTPVYDLMVVPREIKQLDTVRLCELLQMPVEEFRLALTAAKTYSRVKASPLIQNLSTPELAAIQDNLIDFPGFSIRAHMARSYKTENLAHALGYVGAITPKLLESPKYAKYIAGDNLGITGLESFYEKTLMGRRGVQYRMVNVRGIEKGAFRDGEYDTLSVAGLDLHTSIDSELQQYGEMLMAQKRGSIVALDPKTGEILAFVSAPNFEPARLSGKGMGNRYMDLLNNPERPLFNRPLMATYPPGSVFKLVNELVALQMGVVTPYTSFPCNQRLVKCTHRHEPPTNVGIAIKQSCNPYFYQVMRTAIMRGRSSNPKEDARLGLAEWRRQVMSFGLGQQLGVDLGSERKGSIPSPELYDKMYGRHGWNFRTIYSLSIGQGEIGITGLQMANIMAIIANRGYYYTPHFVRGIGQGGPLPEYRERHYTNIDPQHFDAIIPGMQAVVEGRGGTGNLASLAQFGISVAGKTGTVQNAHGPDHATFAAFAPAEDPQIAIAVFIENAGFGGTSAAPMASLMIEKYLRRKVERTQWETWLEGDASKFIRKR
ncbi:penicillin-binding protein 2 [Hymenobacter qilianensis]|uniref:Penicillin-binding protein 2 n=2 Tax=Hymenobacter qilianensis TaxID=1385715 RepID=A0ACB5PU08_9BACT|nr:penicillin-binding protein 2 [Hymenobacter qilianensis]QNP52914.1 penicillin-binding protein 2 [Hymenobacter qilianensis]GGF71762.1 penicillin-binding protein 2 [Hymenobacter qilianensis]